ncbi:hypothetical protein SAMN04487949_1161 [Halogranum gelatinilyticum]|uniref:Uncharacterized protein n=1 Tax=Halogranum gelatinilyticum TaxID=660521 RepID=A0A1G9R3P6_9EURY|nr:hypothetical protein [Halogranum gelatinilyticum]SDM17843.1 hypothetical protein SAMN04487949_1161 [Halogranum gelatinilyticum]
MPPDEPNDDAKDGPVLDPEELDLSDRDEVAELGDDRFLISPGGIADEVPSNPEPPEPEPEPTPEPMPEQNQPEPAVDAQAVSEWLAESMTDNGFDYGFDATLKFDGSVVRHRMVSNDVVTTFETLMLWYARQIGGDTPVEETLGILLAESDMPITFPKRSLVGLLRRHGLSGDDSIADLVAAIDDADGVTFSGE